MSNSAHVGRSRAAAAPNFTPQGGVQRPASWFLIAVYIAVYAATAPCSLGRESVVLLVAVGLRARYRVFKDRSGEGSSTRVCR